MLDKIDIVIRLREIGSASGQVRKILQDGADEIERLRAPFRNVDDRDWDHIFTALNRRSDKDRFWISVLNEMRVALKSQ